MHAGDLRQRSHFFHKYDNKNHMNNIQNSFNLPEVSLESLLWNMLTCTILSLVMCCHFNMRSKKRFLRRDLGLVLPVICLTTLLVISVVKSSLALSLGLVGALSIVRFRTPIKEPEELAYIFLAIAIGLALGADQREVAAIAMVIILVVISVIDRFRPSFIKSSGNLLLNIEVDKCNENLLRKVLKDLPFSPKRFSKYCESILPSNRNYII